MATKAKVSLKQKKIANGKISLYLEYNMPTRRREFLGMYLYADPKKTQINYNKETLATAETIFK